MTTSRESSGASDTDAMAPVAWVRYTARMECTRLGRRAGMVVVAVVVTAVVAAPATAADEPMQRAEVATAGVSVAYPSEWTEIPMTRKDQRALEGRLFKQDPDLAEQAFAAAEALDKSTRFHAIQLGEVPQGFHDAVRVGLLPARFPTDSEIAAYIAGLERQGYTVSWIRDVIGRETVFRITAAKDSTSPDGTTARVLVGRLLVRHGKRTTAIDTRTLDDDTGRALTDAILDGVQLV